MRKLSTRTQTVLRFLVGDLSRYLSFSIAFVLVMVSNVRMSGQCLVVNSTNGYQVTIAITPSAVVAPTTCDYGYNYNLTYNYNITFSGRNIPSNLYTLQGNFTCDDGTERDRFFFRLPNGGGRGTLTTTSNPSRSQKDCAGATPELLGCGQIDIQIHGPGIPNQTISCSAILPIELASFVAEPKREVVEVVWVTSSELNNDHFQVERSADGANWEVVERIAGAGTSTQDRIYKIIDTAPLPGQSYYRLKQTDFDGQFSYSDVQAVSFTGTAFRELQVFPNPTSGKMTIDGVSGGSRSVAIFDALGRRADDAVSLQIISDTRFEVDVSALPRGIYLIKTDRATARFFKQ